MCAMFCPMYQYLGNAVLQPKWSIFKSFAMSGAMVISRIVVLVLYVWFVRIFTYGGALCKANMPTPLKYSPAVQWSYSYSGVPNRAEPAWYNCCVDSFEALLWLSDRVCNKTVAIAWYLRALCLIRRHATVSLYAPQCTTSIKLQTTLNLL